MITPPAPDEYSAFYAGYVAAVPAGDPIALLPVQGAAVREELAAVGEARAGEPPAPGKWSVKDVVAHLADTERVMAYRALRIARGDATPLAGFEQDDYARAANATARPLASLLDELAAVRAATHALFAGLPAEAFTRRGTANGGPASVRALLYVVLGHEAHHRRLLTAAR